MKMYEVIMNNILKNLHTLSDILRHLGLIVCAKLKVSVYSVSSMISFIKL